MKLSPRGAFGALPPALSVAAKLSRMGYAIATIL
jgi:hypothetical protein